MDQQVLVQLDQIEAAAEKILSETDSEKQRLLAANEARIAEFDQMTETRAAEEIRRLRTELEAQHTKETEQLKHNTEKMRQMLQTQYRDRKEQIAEEIVKEILQ